MTDGEKMLEGTLGSQGSLRFVRDWISQSGWNSFSLLAENGLDIKMYSHTHTELYNKWLRWWPVVNVYEIEWKECFKRVKYRVIIEVDYYVAGESSSLGYSTHTHLPCGGSPSYINIYLHFLLESRSCYTSLSFHPRSSCTTPFWRRKKESKRRGKMK